MASGNNNDLVGLEDLRRLEYNLQHHSRVFGQFLVQDDADQSSEGRFFVPTYLRGSTYMRKLAEAHRTKMQAQQDLKRSAGPELPGHTSSFSPATLPHGSHRGLSHNVIERQPPTQEEDSLTPLPSKWNKDDAWTNLEVHHDGRTVKYVGSRNQNERDHEASAVRTDHHMPPQCGIYYYEVEIVSSKKDEYAFLYQFGL